MNQIQKISLFAGSFILVVAFNNCGKGFVVAESDLASAGLFSTQPGETCDAALMRVYEKTYFPFLSQTCASCHTNGPGLGQFGSSDLSTSFNAFTSIGNAKINHNATNDNHQPPATGSHNQARIDELTAEWASVQPAYTECLSASGNVVNSANEVVTNSKNIPTNLNGKDFVRMEWDLETESSRKVPMVAGIDIRLSVINNITRGYELRNPTLRLKDATSGNYETRALNIKFNGLLYPDITTYSNIDYIISTATDFNLSANTANSFIYTTPADGQTLALDFSYIVTAAAQTTGSGTTTTPGTTTGTGTGTGTTTPTTVPTFTQLSASGGVFANSCFGCHNASRAAGGLDLTVYANAKLAAGNIKSRINNAANPMPTGGLLPQAQRDLVNAWLNGGTPQ